MLTYSLVLFQLVYKEIMIANIFIMISSPVLIHAGPALQTGFCATYSECTELLSITDCPYFQLNVFNITFSGYINLPDTLIELNDSMCAPLNRRGIVCSDCISGFGPSVNSFGYRCIRCSSAWYGILLYTVLELIPMTVLYLIFQIRLTSAP